ncbi:MAG: hypothetical protein IOD12_10920 [Silvanigrellales bacterium]|nr:hypothetical protein [Silvanigrellales bacterium]
MKKIFTLSRSCVFFAVLSSCGPDSETTRNSALSSEPMSAFCTSVLSFYSFQGRGLLYMTENTKIFLEGRNPNDFEVVPKESRTTIEHVECRNGGEQLFFREKLVGKIKIKKSLFRAEKIEPFEGLNEVTYDRSSSGKTTMRVLYKTNDGRTLKEIEFDSVSISDDRLVYSGKLDVECPLGTSLLGVKCIVNVEASAEKSPSLVDFFQQGEVEIIIGNRIMNRQPIPRALIGSSEMP